MSPRELAVRVRLGDSEREHELGVLVIDTERDTVHGGVAATVALLRAVAAELDQQRDTEGKP
ncbi:hypothetical protein [Saccharopolyspora kobensis]|nr:hypothetical protein [Saccharopolyspora kobensis]